MKRSKLSMRRKVTAVMVGTLVAVGGATTAFAAQDGGSGSSTSTTAAAAAPAAQPATSGGGAKVCAKLPQIEQRIRTRHDHLTTRLATLRTARQKAVDAKQPAKVVRIDQRISHVTTRIARVEKGTADARRVGQEPLRQVTAGRTPPTSVGLVGAGAEGT